MKKYSASSKTTPKIIGLDQSITREILEQTDLSSEQIEKVITELE